jgi:hypothetical protein
MAHERKRLRKEDSLREEEIISDLISSLLAFLNIMIMKGVDRANQYLAYYSLLTKTVKWTKKVALWLINCALFNSFLVYRSLHPRSKLKYKKCLVQVAYAWATDN